MREQAFQQQQAMERERQAAILARQRAEQEARDRAVLEEEMRVREAARMAEFQRVEAIRLAGTLRRVFYIDFVSTLYSSIVLFIRRVHYRGIYEIFSMKRDPHVYTLRHEKFHT